MNNAYTPLLCCPNCSATAAQGLQVAQGVCTRCETHFFNLNGLPCWFPAGTQQKQLWNHLLDQFIHLGQQQEEAHFQSLNQLGLTPATKNRMQAQQATRHKRHHSVVATLRQAGLKPEKNTAFSQYQATGFSQYYDLVLRDWGWQEGALDKADDQSIDNATTEHYRCYRDENALSLQQCKSVLDNLDGKKIKNCLVLGAGAGRLSWDLHCLLQPGQTLAIDNNPFLAYVAHCLIKGNSVPSFHEERPTPRRNLSSSRSWALRCPAQTKALHASWNIISADAWALPLQEGQFDLILTPWFMDVCGRDAKALIGLVDKMLSPAGHWLNYGPLLYGESAPLSQRYTPEELRQLMAWAKFEILEDRFETLPYSYSPCSERGRMEECWSFLARGAADKNHLHNGGLMQRSPSARDLAHWVCLPHLPIPDIRQAGLLPEALHNIEILIDGTRSLDDLAKIFAGKTPAELTPKEFAEGLVRDFLLV